MPQGPRARAYGNTAAAAASTSTWSTSAGCAAVTSQSACATASGLSLPATPSPCGGLSPVNGSRTPWIAAAATPSATAAAAAAARRTRERTVAATIRSPLRRAAAAGAAVAVGVVASAVGGARLPFTGETPPDVTGISGSERPLTVARALVDTAAAHPDLVLQAVVLAAAAALLPYARARGPWGIASLGAAVIVTALLPAPAVAALPVILATWAVCAAVAVADAHGH